MKPITNLSASISDAGKRLRKSAIVTLAAAAMLSASIAPTSAHTIKEIIEYKIFVLQCAVMLITDPIAHLSVCGEGDTSKLRSLAPLLFDQYIKPEECTGDYMSDCPS